MPKEVNVTKMLAAPEAIFDRAAVVEIIASLAASFDFL